MKKTLKLISSLLFTMILILSNATTAFAANATITYTGKDYLFDFEPGSEYTETDLFDNFKNVMPGDILTQKITVTNKATDCDYIKLYMKAKVHDEKANPVSEGVAAAGETVATMTDFLSHLSMKIYNGNTLLYEASSDELSGLKENVLLGTFRKGESTVLTVELEVPITLGNKYAYRVGEVDWVFQIEAFDDPETQETQPDESQSDDSEPLTPPDYPNNPQTGDTSHLFLYIVIAGAAIICLIFLVIFRRNKDSEEN